MLQEDVEVPVEAKCEMIRKGYMDDPWNTDQAWREVELWHVHFTGNEALSQNFLVNVFFSFTQNWDVEVWYKKQIIIKSYGLEIFSKI